MKAGGLWQVLVLVLGVVALGAILSVVFSGFLDFRPVATISAAPPKGAAASPGGGLAYNPPKPDEAPAGIREAVLLGARLMADTGQQAPGYVGNALTCTNCHFSGGLSPGGKNGGLSLVGVAATYPKYRERQHAAVDLVIRINDCFQRSMNGKPLPPDSREMVALLTYFQWIAKGLPVYGDLPWLTLKPIPAAGTADRAKGQAVFAAKCSACHGPGGQGTPAAPPVWGKDSYNDGAGMAKAESLAAFALLNMPRGNPTLTEAEAADVAAFVDGQPRPRFGGK